ncbi:MAG: AAA family ATPase, partial [Methylococcaceae bacterium]|nr:AAA family ATPase [Methylococcaceae bacterium]
MSPAQAIFERLKQQISTQIIGQSSLIERMLISLLADGHLLVEGAPGLAKTRAINILSQMLAADFHRVQFTPDLLPADLTGTDIFRPQSSSFEFQPGPLFHNLILADEINRAPAKVQAALLEAMAERQISVGKASYALPKIFMVMATQNPLEQEGTYPLPEAQLDRFLMKVNIDYPDASHEQAILQLARQEAKGQLNTASQEFEPIDLDTVRLARQEVLDIFMAPALESYLLEIILATRKPAVYGKDLATWISYGASPRASIALDRCVRAKAWLQ